jgi:nitrogen fixation NifU-like protein
MSKALYHDAILAAARARTGAGRLAAPDRSITRDNPLCGDRVTLDVHLDGDRVLALGQTTRGCLLTEAAASILAGHAAGLDAAALGTALADLRSLLDGRAATPPHWPDLAIFQPVATIKSRHECVLLPFLALDELLADRA